MRKVITLYNNCQENMKHFIISNEMIDIREKSVGVRIKRSDNNQLLSKYEFFPRYTRQGQVLIHILAQNSVYTEIEMPEWLYKSHIRYGFRIAS